MQNRKYTFAVTVEIDEPSGLNKKFLPLSIRCELASGDKTNEGPPDFYPDDALSREKIGFRIDYIFRHLETFSVQLWNESKLAAEIDTGDLAIKQVHEALARWEPELIPNNAKTRLGERRGRPAKLDRKTLNEMDLIYAKELKIFDNAREFFEALRKTPQFSDWRAILSRMLDAEHFECVEEGFTALDKYNDKIAAQPSAITYAYLFKKYGLSRRELERIISKAGKRRERIMRAFTQPDTDINRQ